MKKIKMIGFDLDGTLLTTKKVLTERTKRALIAAAARGVMVLPSLTVRKSKNRCIPYGYWAAAIFAVVADYSILFFPFTFFLNISHFTFCYELIICSETTDVMKIIRNSFSFV